VKMAYFVGHEGGSLIVELRGGITARDVGELAKAVSAALSATSAVTIRARDVDDIDTCALQLLVSLQKTVASFRVEEPSDAFRNAAGRCALGRELAAAPSEAMS